ncbi:MAG: putative inorganic carbon transporter subunit DabA, partial [Planctomycetaceae bacterium]
MSPPPGAAFQPPSERLHDLQHLIEHAAHLLPSQGPITVFVHHNTLHPFEDLTFDEATRRGMSTYGCQTYLSESAYRRLLAEGRILERDLETVLIEQLGDAGEELLGFMGPRHHLYMAMLQRPLLVGSDAELRWLMAETDALIRFREETPVSLKRQSIGDTRAWAVREVQNGIDGADHPIRETILQLSQTFGRSQPGSWNDKTAEAFTLHLLWHVCLNNTYDFGEPQPVPLRHRDLLLRVIGADSDRLVNEILIPFCAAFLDQGYAHWSLPDRDRGFFQAFLALYRDGRPAQRWMRRLPLEIASIIADGQTPLECIAESLQFLGVARSEQGEYVSQTLLALRGWAGMLWQMETNAEWTVHPAPPGTLIEYLAVRLLLERLVLHEIAEDDARFSGSLADLRDQLQERIVAKPAVSIEQRAYSIFQLAQVRGWSPHDLYQLTSDEWLRLTHEVERFSSFERRRIYHLAYERRYRTQALHAIHVHASQAPAGHSRRPTFQIITCIDDREESFRRHLEEIDPRCETFGAAGFFGVAIYYRGAADAHFRPLCPVIMKPQHYVRESVAYSLTSSSLQREDTRRTLGAAYHHWHAQSRTFAGGIVTALLGSLASIPMVTRILFPRMTAQMRRIFGSLVQVPPVTELLLERTSDPPSPEAKHLGFSVTE